MKDPQSHRGHIPGERLDARPVQEMPRCDPAPERAREQPPQSPAAARVHANNPPPALDSRQLDLIGADEAGSIDVDELVVEDVVFEQHLLGPPLESAQVELCLDEPDLSRRDLGDRLGGEVRLPPGDSDEEARDRRIAGSAQANDEIVDRSEASTISLANRAARHGAEVEDPGSGDCGAHRDRPRTSRAYGTTRPCRPTRRPSPRG